MGIIIKQGSRFTFVSYIGVFIGLINTMFLYPLLLTPEIVGIMRLLLETATILALICQLGSAQSLIKFYPYFKDHNTKDHGFFFYVIIIPLAGILIFGSLFLFFDDSIKDFYSTKSPLFSNYFYLIIPFAIILLLTNLFEAFLTVRLKIVFPKILREIVIRLLTSIIIFGVFLKILNTDTYVYSYIFIYALIAFALFHYIVKYETISLKPDFHFITPPLKKEILWFMTFMIIAGIGNSIVNKVDVLMLGAKMGVRETGIFSIAFFIASIVEFPYRSIGLISAPIVSEAIKKNDWILVKDIYKKSALNQLIIAGIIFFLIWINIHNIYAIMPNGNIYKQGIWVVLFIGIAKIIDSAAGTNTLIMGYSGIYRLTMLYMVFLLGLAYVTNNALIPIYGITGSAIATAISIFLYNLLLSSTIWFKYHIQPFTNKTLTVLLIFVILYGLDFAIPFAFNAYVDAFIRSLFTSLIFIILILKLKVSDEITGITKFWIDKVPVKIIRNIFQMLY